MHTDSDSIYILITKSLTGELSAEETSILEEWLAEHPDNQSEYDDVLSLWKRTASLQFPVKIDRSAALQQVHEKAGIKKLQILKRSLFYQVAAVLLVSVLLAGTYSYFNSKSNKSMEYFQEVSAAFGTRSQIHLPDGSTAYLNSGSSLKFSNLFGTQKQRLIELTGEGFFEVAKDADHPFIVKAGSVNVKALGTKFNVNAYNPEKSIDVALLEGKVGVSSDNFKNDKNLLVLTPSQLAHFDASKKKLSKSTALEMEKHIGWIDGKMVFIDDPIQELVRKLENWYNVDIQIKDQRLLKYRFTGTFINESVEEVLQVLSLTSPMSFIVEPVQKDANGNYSKRVITLNIDQ